MWLTCWYTPTGSPWLPYLVPQWKLPAAWFHVLRWSTTHSYLPGWHNGAFLTGKSCPALATRFRGGISSYLILCHRVDLFCCNWATLDCVSLCRCCDLLALRWGMASRYGMASLWGMASRYWMASLSTSLSLGCVGDGWRFWPYNIQIAFSLCMHAVGGCQIYGRRLGPAFLSCQELI